MEDHLIPVNISEYNKLRDFYTDMHQTNKYHFQSIHGEGYIITRDDLIIEITKKMDEIMELNKSIKKKSFDIEQLIKSMSIWKFLKLKVGKWY